MNNSIIIEDIHKTYGTKQKVHALQAIDLKVNKGSIFGLIGPDGAGKTSLFRILTTLLVPDRGHATIEKFDIIKDYRPIRKIIGYMPGKFSLYGDLSVQENINFFATIFQTTFSKNYDLIKDIYQQLEPFKDRKARDLSGGMKQKLALSCALIHKPKVLFLDEPTTGVDAVSRKEFWDILDQLKKTGMTIFVSTPYMDEANRCDEIALIQDGMILSTSTPDHLTDNYPRTIWAVQSDNMYKLYKDLIHHPLVLQCYTFGAVHHVQFTSNDALTKIKTDLSHLNHHQLIIKKINPTIEDCFLDLMTQKTPRT